MDDVSEKRLERIEAKIDDSNDHLASIDVTLASQHASLREHIRRSNMLEAKMAPVERHVNRVEGALKLITLAAALAAVAEFIMRR